MVIVGIGFDCGINTALEIGAICKASNIPFAIAEQSVGSMAMNLLAGDLLLLVAYGATAIFTEYDFIADDAVMNLVLENERRQKLGAILMGDPALRAKSLIDEVRLVWNDPDDEPVNKPKMTFRLACALTQVPELSHDLTTCEQVATEINNHGWFPYNVDDARKAVGALASVWDLSKKNLYLLPQKAKERGFPHPSRADELFQFIDDRLDFEERIYKSAYGNRFDILYVYEV